MIEAWNNGVPGDGSDQTVALQAIVAGLPAEGGQIALRGDVVHSSLDLKGKHNIRFIGEGGIGTGSAQVAMLRTNALSGRVIDARDSFAIAFERLFMHAMQPTFAGTLLDFGKITTGSAYARIRDCSVVNGGGAGSIGVNLYGSTQGAYDDVAFMGPGRHVALQDVADVGFCNQHRFSACAFKPNGSLYPVVGAAEGITFENCNVQASSLDGVGRFWQGSLNQDFRGASILGCTFFDVLAGAGEWVSLFRGNAFVFIGNRVGGYWPPTGPPVYSAGVRLGGGVGGVRGFVVLGNNFDATYPGVSFAGSIAAKTHARDGLVGGNYVAGPAPTLFGSLNLSERVVITPNTIEGLPNAPGAHMNLGYSLPTSATGLQPGDLWNSAGTIKVV